MRKKILYALVGVVVIMQLLRPTRNVSDQENRNDIALHYAVPADLQQVLKTSCYDCHSNNTRYPWYVNIQPIGWWLQSHVSKGKGELNFSEFGTYNEKKARHKFEEIEEMITQGEMPLKPYLWLHEDARLSAEQAKALVAWATALK